MTVDGKEKTFTNPIVTIDDKTYIPLREVSGLLKTDINWDDDTKTIALSKRETKKNLYVFKKNNLYGYMNHNGKIVIPAKYSYADDFSEGLATVKSEKGYGYINEKGETIIDFHKNWWDADKFKDGIARVELAEHTDDYDYRYINTKGEYVLDPDYEGLGSFYDDYAVAIISGYYPMDYSAKQCTYINKNGERATSETYEEAYNFSEGFAVVKKNGKYGLINNKFEVVVNYQYDDMYPAHDGFVAVKQNDKWGYVTTTGKKVVACQYADARDFAENMAAVCDENVKWGYINTQGKTCIPMQYDRAANFSEGVATVKANDKYGVIDSSDAYIIKPQYKYLLSLCTDGLIMACDEDRASDYYYINIDNQKIELSE